MLIADRVTPPTNSTDLTLVDVNKDGRLDVVIAFGGLEAPLVWIENDGTSPENWVTTHVLNSTTTHQYAEVASGDFNQDGWPDLAASGVSTGYLDWFPSQGGGTHDTRKNIGSEYGARQVADFDRDGRVDLLVYGNSTLELYCFDGTATWSGQTLGTTTGQDHQLGLGDIDGDGDIDAVSAQHDRLTVWGNDGSPPWPSTPIWTIISQRAATVGDLDRDGDLDIASWNGAGAYASQGVWFDNDGAASPTFTPSRRRPARTASPTTACSRHGTAVAPRWFPSRPPRPNPSPG